ncbi:dihydrofolate reductase [Candidatus Peribacteria bacterium]|nr:dihydrofolate reductase [Candidatus Peribacteria bacterium]
MLSLIVAASENNVIGKDNKLPWHLPDDLKRFKALTRGHPMIMGRKTFESIGRALPDRLNIVVSNTLENAPAGTSLAHSLTAALDLAKDSDEAFIIGGAKLFEIGLSLAEKLYLTRVHATIDGDVFFPEITDEWKEKSREHHKKDAEHEYAFTFINFERIQ